MVERLAVSLDVTAARSVEPFDSELVDGFDGRLAEIERVIPRRIPDGVSIDLYTSGDPAAAPIPATVGDEIRAQGGPRRLWFDSSGTSSTSAVVEVVGHRERPERPAQRVEADGGAEPAIDAVAAPEPAPREWMVALAIVVVLLLLAMGAERDQDREERPR